MTLFTFFVFVNDGAIICILFQELFSVTKLHLHPSLWINNLQNEHVWPIENPILVEKTVSREDPP